MKITIVSGKGGTGKTTVPSNLISYFALLGKKLAFADSNIEELNSTLFLNAKLVHFKVQL